MAYKYPALKSIANRIRSGDLPPDIEWTEVYAFWIKHHSTVKTQHSWKAKPRFYNRALTSNARAKKYGLLGKVTADDLETVWNFYAGKCNSCKKTQSLVFDHIVPLYRGGAHTVDNLQLLCRICNMEKGVNNSWVSK